MDSFPCTSCGLCCKHVDVLLKYGSDNVILQELIDRFPYKPKLDGSCSQLDNQNRCLVYNNRPLMCNIKLVGILLKQPMEEYFKLNIQICNAMIREAGLDESYLI
jgi:Fe-S-cluster containining protein